MTTPTDLNAILFAQLERLQNADADKLESEIQKAEAIEKVSRQVINNNNTRLVAVKLIAEHKGIKNIEGVELPQTLIG